MATVNIPVQGVTWSGTPRAASPQYIQTAINLGASGTEYILGAGTHRGQEIDLDSNDILLLAEGAILSGCEPIATTGWTPLGGNVWSKAIENGDRTISDAAGINCEGGYDCKRGEKILLDGEMMAYRTSSGDVDSWHAYADGTNIRIGRDPAGLSTIEVIRTQYIRGLGAELGGVSSSERGEIYGYVGATGASGGSNRGAIRLQGTAPLLHDLEIHSTGATAVAVGDDTVLRNVTIRHAGQLGICDDGVLGSVIDNIEMLEGCIIIDNGISGWRNGWEGGNSKFKWTENLLMRGTLWIQTDDPRFSLFGNEPPGVMWFDIANDGFILESNVFVGGDTDWRGGVFIEISYSGKIRRNIFYHTGRTTSGQTFQLAATNDFSGAIPGTTVFSTLEVENNLMYGGAGGYNLMAGGFHDLGTQGFDRKGSYVLAFNDIHHNTVYLKEDSLFDEWIGLSREGGLTLEPHDNEWNNNMYLVKSGFSNYWDNSDGGGGTGQSFSTWQGNGNDVNGTEIQGSDYDPAPFNGGAM